MKLKDFLVMIDFDAKGPEVNDPGDDGQPLGAALQIVHYPDFIARRDPPPQPASGKASKQMKQRLKKQRQRQQQRQQHQHHQHHQQEEEEELLSQQPRRLLCWDWCYYGRNEKVFRESWPSIKENFATVHANVREETLFVATRMASSFSMFRIKHGDGDVFTDGLVAKNAVDPELLDRALEAIERIGLPADPGLALLAAVITQARQESSQARVDQLLEDPNTRAIYERVQAELAKTDSEKEDGDGDGDGRRDDGEDG